jgi:hypothetical protein
MLDSGRLGSDPFVLTSHFVRPSRLGPFRFGTPKESGVLRTKARDGCRMTVALPTGEGSPNEITVRCMGSRWHSGG